MRVWFQSTSFMQSVGSELLFQQWVWQGMRFPAVVLTCWFQLFSFAWRILKFLLKLPYSCNAACISQLQVLLCKIIKIMRERFIINLWLSPILSWPFPPTQAFSCQIPPPPSSSIPARTRSGETSQRRRARRNVFAGYIFCFLHASKRKLTLFPSYAAPSVQHMSTYMTYLQWLVEFSKWRPNIQWQTSPVVLLSFTTMRLLKPSWVSHEG